MRLFWQEIELRLACTIFVQESVKKGEKLSIVGIARNATSINPGSGKDI